jgi:hypothetical protein
LNRQMDSFRHWKHDEWDTNDLVADGLGSSDPV